MTLRRALGALLILVFVASAMDLPRKSPALEIGMNGGKPLQIEGYRGKAVVLAFILTTCPHCQHTTGILKQLQTDYGPRGVQIVEAAVDQNAEMLVPSFVQRFAPNFPVGFVLYDTAAAYLQHSPLLIMHVPALVFIDRQGTIRAEYEGDDKFFLDDMQEKNLRDQIEKLLHSGDTTRKTAKK
jgi:cytochrome oxidase Cu insertion factor (SCO1/SenC/PrrC family)